MADSLADRETELVENHGHSTPLADKLSPATLDAIKNLQFLKPTVAHGLSPEMEKTDLQPLLNAAKMGDMDAVVNDTGMASASQLANNVIKAASTEIKGENPVVEYPMHDQFLKATEALAGTKGTEAYAQVLQADKAYVQANMGGDENAITSSQQAVLAAAKQFGATVQAGVLKEAAREGAITMDQATAVAAPSTPPVGLASNGMMR